MQQQQQQQHFIQYNKAMTAHKMDVAPTATTEIDKSIPDIASMTAPTTAVCCDNGTTTTSPNNTTETITATTIPPTSTLPIELIDKLSEREQTDPAMEHIHAIRENKKSMETMDRYLQIFKVFMYCFYGGVIMLPFFIYLDWAARFVLAFKASLIIITVEILKNANERYNSNFIKRQAKKRRTVNKEIAERMLRCDIKSPFIYSPLDVVATSASEPSTSNIIVQKDTQNTEFYHRTFNTVVLVLFGYFIILPSIPTILKSVMESKILWTVNVIVLAITVAYRCHWENKMEQQSNAISIQLSMTYAEMCRRRELLLALASLVIDDEKNRCSTNSRVDERNVAILNDEGIPSPETQ